MGSIGEPTAPCVTFSIGVDDEPQSNPWTERGYLNAPQPNHRVKISCPLIDYRPTAFASGSNGGANVPHAKSLLRQYGFTVLKHRSALQRTSALNETDLSVFQSIKALDDVYFSEIIDLVKQMTGCKQVFVINSLGRGGPSLIDDTTTAKFVNPTDRVLGPKASPSDMDHTKPYHYNNAKPARLPHNDFTPLGARQVLRSLRPDIRQAGEDAGIIAKEDELCNALGVSATANESVGVVEELYNASALGMGPRYATYSLWRPLRTVTRDPLALATRQSVLDASDLVLWSYDLRSPGDRGDFLWNLEQLKCRPESLSKRGEQAEMDVDVPWFYVSDQQPDEVLMIKLFDSAALGIQNEAGGPVHASPDVGDGDARNSIDVRVLAVW